MADSPLTDQFLGATYFWTVSYYSVVTFTTLCFGDIILKTQEAACWIMAEVIMRYIMLGGLISIFAIKIARRS